jgi:hypothetical protein
MSSTVIGTPNAHRMMYLTVDLSRFVYRSLRKPLHFRLAGDLRPSLCNARATSAAASSSCRTGLARDHVKR